MRIQNGFEQAPRLNNFLFALDLNNDDVISS